MKSGLIQIALSLLAFVGVSGFAGETKGFLCQTITLPAKGMSSRFVDLNGDGRRDLLAIDPLAKKLLIYRQGTSGFTNMPDQTIELPPQTAWIAPYHVEGHRQCELLASTATGLIYYRQNGGAFESEPRTLVKADQIFTNDDPPFLISPVTNAPAPVISATQTWLYQTNEAGQWTSGPPVSLEAKPSIWSENGSTWSLGQNMSYGLNVSEAFRSQSDTAGDEKPENEAIGKLIADMKKTGPWPQIVHLDLNKDGQKDLVIWQATFNVAPKSDIYIFLRGADGKLPEQPTQVLHCRGNPIPVGSTRMVSPLADLKGDGTYELVLLEPKVLTTSLGGLWDMALTRGVDMALTIRLFNQGSFSRSADATVPLTGNMSIYGFRQWPFFICGDFNGDGRPDLVVQRPSGRWDIFPSTDDGHWFRSQPALAFAGPAQGYFERSYFEIADLNGDGRSDIVLRDLDNPRIFIFLTQPKQKKGSP